MVIINHIIITIDVILILIIHHAIIIINHIKSKCTLTYFCHSKMNYLWTTNLTALIARKCNLKHSKPHNIQ